jgi:chorismate mutase
VELLGERMGISDIIGDYKKEHHLAIHQSKRWASIVKNAVEKGTAIGLTEDFIIKIFQQIHNESIVHQSKVFEQSTQSESVTE